MTAYATPTELAGFLQKDIDTYSAQLVLDKASALFSVKADTQFLPTTAVWSTIGNGRTELRIPFWPIISVTSITVAGVTVTDYSRIKRTLFRLIGWGVPGRYPPDEVVVTLSHGYAAVPEDVKGAVLETAGAAYQSPDNTTLSESIDDYAVKFSAEAGGLALSHSASQLAALYRGTFTG